MNIDWEHVPPSREMNAIRAAAESEQLAALSGRSRQAPRLLVVGALAASAVALTGAGLYAVFAPVEDTSMIRCFTDTSLDGDAIYVSTIDSVDGDGLIQIGDPVAACGDLWTQGVLVSGIYDAQPPTPGANLPVPPLTACVLNDTDAGPIVGVFPGGSDVCDLVGLAPWRP